MKISNLSSYAYLAGIQIGAVVAILASSNELTSSLGAVELLCFSVTMLAYWMLVDDYSPVTRFYLGTALLVWQFTLLIPFFITNNDVVHTLEKAPYLQHKLDLKPIPLPVLRKLVKRIGVNTYGGELISQDIIHQNYNIPEYLYPAIRQQANYVNSLQQAKLINGVPVALSYFNLPSAHDIKKVEDTTATKYMALPNSESKNKRIAGVPVERSVYGKLVNRIKTASSPDFLLRNTLSVSQLNKFRFILNKYYSHIRIRELYTHLIGNPYLVAMYHTDVKDIKSVVECHTALGPNNSECKKLAVSLPPINNPVYAKTDPK